MPIHLGQADARRTVLELVDGAQGYLPIAELRARLPAHRHAADRAARLLTGEGRLLLHEVVVPDRRGRPRVGLALAPAAVPHQLDRPTPLPRFSGQALRRARLRASVSVAALARALGVDESAVRSWERSPVVPPARGRDILQSLAHLQLNAGAHCPVSPRTAIRLRDARVAAGFSQARLAAMLRVSQSTIANWEAGRGLTRENAQTMYRVLRQVGPAPRIDINQLRELRARRGWSQSELARRAGVGVATIKRWETGRTAVPAHRTEVLLALASA